MEEILKRDSWMKAGGVVVAALILLALVFAHVPHINGPWYWQWTWRSLPMLKAGPLLMLGSLPVLIGVYFAGKTIPNWAAIMLIMLGSFSMRLGGAAVLSEPMSLDFVRRATVDPLIGSYYSSAAKIAPLDNILSFYWELLNWDPSRPHLDFHAVNKPPGPTLYYLIFIRAMGDTDKAALWSGIGLGILATLAIPCAYLFTRRVTANNHAALLAAAWLALSPGFVLFFPMVDPVYPIFTCLLSLWWFCALKEDRWYWSAVFGLGLFAATFVNYSILVIGIFLAGMIFIVPQVETVRDKIVRGLKHACIATASCVAAYVILYLGWSFNPVVTFFAAYKAQSDLISTSPRSKIFPHTVPWDLYDFLLGAGWIVAVIIGYWLARRDFRSTSSKLVFLAFMQIVLTAATGLLQAETARVWNFLLPLLLLPVGLELSKWSRQKIVVALAMLVLLTAAIHINMTFINERP